jgi:cyclophilin family peptidyl-prolyl cis-trans isomerase
MRKFLSLSLSGGLFLLASSTFGATTPAVVELQTNLGTIAVQLNYAKAPITTANFMEYVDSGFFRGTLIHRVVKDFVLQGGGYSRTDGQLKTNTRPPIINESTNGLSNVTGTIAMARTADPNSATSQFFINLKDNTGLDYISPAQPGYAVFGRVMKGMAVARKIEARATFRELPFTAASQLIWIEAVYGNETWDTTVSHTRISRSGAGTVVSDPPGIQCGTGCTLSQPKGSALKLTATPATDYAFGGWRGDCQGERRTINLDTNKGNHNCTAVFTALGAALQ